jgi:cold shock protein
MSEILTGTVKWFNAEKGFGFISAADGRELFVHVRALAEGRTTLAAGDRVYFTARESPKGPEAADVRVGAPPPPPKPALPTVELAAPAQSARVRMRLIGRPAATQQLGHPDQAPSVVAFVLEASADLHPTMLKQLPAPAGATAFLVLISFKHWRRVAGALEVDPQDTLVIDGYAGLDPLAPNMITVRATSVATTGLLQARRAAQAAAREKLAAPEGSSQEAPSGDEVDAIQADGEGEAKLPMA